MKEIWALGSRAYIEKRYREGSLAGVLIVIGSTADFVADLQIFSSLRNQAIKRSGKEIWA
jgi:hypothetical protein